MDPSPDPALITHDFRVMGTDARLVLRETGTASRELLEEAEAELRRLDMLLTRFRSTSELERLNDAGSADVGPEMLELLHAAADYTVQTDGRFDIGLGAQVVAAGYDRTYRELPQVGDAERDALRQRMMTLAGSSTSAPDGSGSGTATARRLTPNYRIDGTRVTLRPGVRVDLGGLAKGWASDRIARSLAEQSGASALASLGGDISVVVQDGDDPWPVAASIGREGSMTLALAFGGIATSGWDGRMWATSTGTGIAHHVIDPVTGESAMTDVAQITVVGATCIDAEVWAKALMLVGAQAARAEAEARDITALIIRADDTCIRTGALA